MLSTGIKKIIFPFSAFVLILVQLSFAYAKNNPVILSNRPTQQLTDSNNIDKPRNSSTANSIAASFVFDSLNLERLGLSREAFDNAIHGFNKLYENGRLSNDRIITIIDFSKASSQKRLFILDMEQGKLLCHTYVSHGVNTGLEYARNFSNIPESNQSSLGFYQTGGTYIGKNGFSMKLIGLEKGFNDNAESRAIVMHAAPYVNAAMARSKGYIGRSWGCPAVPVELHKKIIDLIKGGTCLFIYSPNINYLAHSRVING